MANTDKQIHKAISDWLGDIVALESHVEEALDHQLKLQATNSNLTTAIRRFHDTVRDSKHSAEAYQKQYGSTAGNPVIKAGSELLGKAAGMIDRIRSDSVAKALRDDYTAFNHVAIAYTMLHTTAMAMADNATQAFAEEGLRTYARMVQELNYVIPEAVVYDLKNNSDDPVVNPDVVESCRQTVSTIWQSTSSSGSSL